MTTTFAARNHTLLQLMKTPIGNDDKCYLFYEKFKTVVFSVIIEEAAEVLESHIVAALTSSTQHLILIGRLFPYSPVYVRFYRFRAVHIFYVAVAILLRSLEAVQKVFFIAFHITWTIPKRKGGLIF